MRGDGDGFLVSLELRPYQLRDVAAIRDAFGQGHRAVCYVAPTGSGKTVLFCYIAAEIAKRARSAWILVHRQELLLQTSRALTAFGVPHGLISPAFPLQPDVPMQVASVQTLVRRLDKLKPPNLIISDECHHATSPTWRAVFDRCESSKILGVTATPQRLDGRGLKAIFQTMLIGPSTRELTEAGYLARATAFAPPRVAVLDDVKVRAGEYAIDELDKRMDQKAVTGDAVEHYRKICPGAPAIAFCVSVDHARHVAEEFTAGGYRSVSVDGGLNKETRAERINGLADGSVQVLTSCELISEGLDIPLTTAAILLRPTKSLGLCRQQIGRVLRPAPGKERAYIIDHVGNIYEHGLPTDEIAWTLDGRVKRDSKAAPVKQCPECYCSHGPAPFCPECGHIYETVKDAVGERARGEYDHAEGELVEVADVVRGAPIDSRDRWRMIAEAKTLKELQALAMKFGYKKGWAWYQWNERTKRKMMAGTG